jgi:AcrR family transcriptional regulator
MRRTYTLKKRAESQAKTRSRIVHAAVDLHGTLGPGQTSISAIARRAGVQRATVYDHFPDEASLFQACTSHYFAQYPPPDPHHWRDIAGPMERLRVALGEVYAYHGRVEPMLSRSYRDADLKPEIFDTDAARAYVRHGKRMAAEIIDAWPPDKRVDSLFAAAVEHALHFQTWRLLVRTQGLTDSEAIELMANLVSCAAPGNRARES